MTSYAQEISKELNSLIEEGRSLHNMLNPDSPDRNQFVNNYQAWYTKAVNVVKVLGPERLDDFVSYHRNDKRKAITYGTYTLCDFTIDLPAPLMAFNTRTAAANKYMQQILIVASLRDVLNSKLANLRTVLEADLYDSELGSARELNKKGHNRSAGSLAGVVLEKHLKSVCSRHSLTIRKSATISPCNDVLKDNEIVDIPTWRLIQRLGDLRNRCSHARGCEPKPDEVDDLISGVDKVIKTIH